MGRFSSCDRVLSPSPRALLLEISSSILVSAALIPRSSSRSLDLTFVLQALYLVCREALIEALGGHDSGFPSSPSTPPSSPPSSSACAAAAAG